MVDGKIGWLVTISQSQQSWMATWLTSESQCPLSKKEDYLEKYGWINHRRVCIHPIHYQCVKCCILMCRKVCLIPRNGIIRACLLLRKARNIAKTAGNGREWDLFIRQGEKELQVYVQCIWNDNTFISRKTFAKLIRTVWKIDGGAQLSVWRYAD